MKKIKVLLCVLVLGVAGSVMALPPEIRFDMLKTRMAGELEAQEWSKVLVSLKEMRELELQLPDSMEFFEGQALFESGKQAEAYPVLERYVTAVGSDGPFYSEALSYLVKAELAYKIGKRIMKELEDCSTPQELISWLNENVNKWWKEDWEQTFLIDESKIIYKRKVGRTVKVFEVLLADINMVILNGIYTDKLNVSGATDIGGAVFVFIKDEYAEYFSLAMNKLLVMKGILED